MPRNILAVPQKRTPSLGSHLAQAIRSYISENYPDTHPDAFAKDVREFCRLRDECSLLEIHVSSIDVAWRYHAQLVFFSTKFPVSIGISFPWSLCFPPSLPLWTSGVSGWLDSPPENAGQSSSSYATSDTVAHPDLVYERANVLFSLASLYSALGTAEGRSESESIKRAIGWFQHAAGIFQHIREALLPEIRYLKPQSPDLTSSLLSCLRDLMLAQAQECFWQKAVLDRLKNNTIAKLAEKVSELYASALDFASSSSVSFGLAEQDDTQPQLPSEWINHITVKRWHFAAAAQYRKSCDDLGANRYGDELGRLEVAEAHVKRALDSSKRGVSDAIMQDLKSLQQIIQTNTQRGTKDNDLIYLEPVTPASNLPAIVAASMVKPVLPEEIANAISFLRDSPAPALGKPLFAELVPYGVHLAIRIYDDRKDSLVREQISEKRDELDGIALSTLQSLNLPGSLQALEQPMGLPPSLLRRHEEVAAEGGIDRLHSIVNDIERIARTDADILSEAFSILDQEAREDGQIRSAFQQQRWPRPPSSEAAADLRAEGQMYADKLHHAAISDAIVRQKLEDWDELIGVLSRGVEDLEAFVPSSAATSLNSSQSEAQVSAVRALRSELESLDDLLDGRAACHAEARSAVTAEDIRPAALREAARISAEFGGSSTVIEAAHFEGLFEREMQKYDRFRDEMRRSAEEQRRILERIAQRNEEFVEARKVDTTVKRREKALQSLDVAYGKYRELASNLVEGLGFYNGMAKQLSVYRQNVKEWARARQIDVANLTAQFAGTSLSLSRPSPSAAANTQMPDNQPAAAASAREQATPRRSTRRRPAAGGVDSPVPTPGRSTRSKAEADPAQQQHQQGAATDPQPPVSQQQSQHRQTDPPLPQWGAFPGGEIRFGN